MGGLKFSVIFKQIGEFFDKYPSVGKKEYFWKQKLSLCLHETGVISQNSWKHPK